MLSLSTCWNSHRHQEGEHIVHEAKALGFKYIELSHGLKMTQLPGLLRVLAEGQVQVSSVHNFCPPPVESMMDAPDLYEYTAFRPDERERALQLTEQTLQFANRINAPLMVVHLGSVPMKAITAELERLTLEGKMYGREYTKAKLKLVEKRTKLSARYMARAKAAIDELLPLCEHYKVKMAVETRSHYEQVPNEMEMAQLMETYKDHPWLGFWHDFGHVQRKANLGLLDHADLLKMLAPRLLGCHVHDVSWPDHDHRIPGTGGCVDYDTLIPLVPKDIPMVWELSPSQKRSEVAAYIVKWREKWGE